MFDGSTVTMPDTPENQQAYPQVYNQKPGLGFPIARIGVITSLSCGAIVNLGFCRYAGKGQGETACSAECGTRFRVILVDLAKLRVLSFATIRSSSGVNARSRKVIRVRAAGVVT